MSIKYLMMTILLFPSLVIAVDETIVQELDAKASTANAKADGNNSRIQALEAEDVILHNRIDNIQLTPGPEGPVGPAGPQGSPGILGLAGKSCPANLAVVGFDSNGDLVCAAPWNYPTGGEPPGITFECTINYDQIATQSTLLTDIGGYLATLESNGLPDQTGSSGGIGYEISNISVSSVAGELGIIGALLDLTEAEPCDDAVGLSVSLPDYVVSGSWSVPPYANGTFSITLSGMVLDYLATLSLPDLSGAVTGDSYDRVFESLVATGASGSATSEVLIGNGSLPVTTSVVEAVMSSFAKSQISVSVGQSLDLVIAPAIGAPVTINVISTP